MHTYLWLCVKTAKLCERRLISIVQIFRYLPVTSGEKIFCHAIGVMQTVQSSIDFLIFWYFIAIKQKFFLLLEKKLEYFFEIIIYLLLLYF